MRDPNKIDPTMDPVVDKLRQSLETAIHGDLLDASRKAGVIPTPNTVAQATMIAGLATRAILRHMQVVRVRCTETVEAIERTNAEMKVQGIEGDHTSGVAMPEIYESIAMAFSNPGMTHVQTITGDGAVSWVATVFAVPADPDEAPAKPTPAFGGIIRPDGGRVM